MATTKKKNPSVTFKEKDLSFWQLGFILSAGQGLVSMRVGHNVAVKYGFGTALTSVWIGNFVLFFIGLGIISMTGKRSHTIQNIKENFKLRFAILPALVIVGVFILWYALHIKHPTDLIAEVVKIHFNLKDTNSTFIIRLGSILGLTCALLSMWGISVIKWLNTFIFPFQILFFIVAFIALKDSDNLFEQIWGFSFIGIVQVMITWLPGTINLSTFSRHARSRAHAILSLFFIFVFHSLFQTCFIALDSKGIFETIFSQSSLNFLSVMALLFLVLSVLSVNFLNIYWASIGWESFFNKEQGAKGYAVIGLIGTIIYIFFESSFFVLILEQVGSIFIACLGVTLISSALVKILIQHRMRQIDRIDNAICWMLGCAASVYAYIFFGDTITALIYGISTSLLACGLIIFSEEFWWSFKKIKQ